MRNIAIIVFCAVFTLPVILFPICAGAAPAQESGSTFGDVENREWILAEVRGQGKTVILDRMKLEADGMGAFFTISFKEGQAGGTGAPNRYFGPYTSGGNRMLSLGNMAATRMLALKEPDGLNEQGYFDYLSKVTRWDLRDGKLELGSSSGGTESILVFIRK